MNTDQVHQLPPIYRLIVMTGHVFASMWCDSEYLFECDLIGWCLSWGLKKRIIHFSVVASNTYENTHMQTW